jgi:TM2 domain-containing membrane protein YozV
MRRPREPSQAPGRAAFPSARPQRPAHTEMPQLDSLNYYKGWAQYSIKSLHQSSISFLKVGPESPFYSKSRFFAGYNLTYLQKYDEAMKIFGEIKKDEKVNLSIANLELCGISMLQGDWSKANDQIQKINPNVPSISKQLDALGKICEDQMRHRPKSSLLAGLMSGIVPGSGKIYAGKTGQGIAGMISTTGFGFVTWENYRELGIGHFKTIFFGSIFLANYVSNIYGSVISVRISDNEYQNALHNQILFQLHIPLRNFFE